MLDLSLKDIFNRDAIFHRAIENWNCKDEKSRQMCGRKYTHIFVKNKLDMENWENDFTQLSFPQKKLLIKSEIIRTYDSLPNSDKTKLKCFLKLSQFSSKWYKLPSKDKRKILNYFIKIN